MDIELRDCEHLQRQPLLQRLSNVERNNELLRQLGIQPLTTSAASQKKAPVKRPRVDYSDLPKRQSPRVLEAQRHIQLTAKWGAMEVKGLDGKRAEAIPLFQEELDGCAARHSEAHQQTRGSAKDLVALLREAGREGEAKALAKQYGV